MATQLVERPDLSRRTALSKSEISTGTWCELQGFYARTDPKPWTPTPDMTFGSCLDAAVEMAIGFLRSGQPVQIERCLAAAAEVALRDDNPVNLDEIEVALEQFGVAIAPQYDWSHALTQHSITVEIDGLGECNGHPDIILTDLILDVKSAGRAKSEDDIYFGSELGFYALLRTRETGDPVRHVGYLTWLRLRKPLWQVLVVPVTDDLLAEAMTRARRQLHLRKLSDTVAAKGADPTLFFDGPRFDKKCLDCAWSAGCSVGQRRLRRLTETEGSDAIAA
jgi:CheY-like chemotaxis protein